MKTKHLTFIEVRFGCLAPLVALAQLGQPYITTQPNDTFLNAPGAVTFTVTASSTGPLCYQWLFNGTAIAGATNRTLPLSNSP